jgi:hypothetical protein
LAATGSVVLLAARIASSKAYCKKAFPILLKFCNMLSKCVGSGIIPTEDIKAVRFAMGGIYNSHSQQDAHEFFTALVDKCAEERNETSEVGQCFLYTIECYNKCHT